MKPHGNLRHFLVWFSSAILSTSALSAQTPQDSPHLVLQNGRTIPLSSLIPKGDGFTVREAVSGFSAGAAIPATAIDYLSCTKPSSIAPAFGELVLGNPEEALKLLQPALTEFQSTARIPGSPWIEAAKIAALAHALLNDSVAADEQVKQISEATPGQGVDPISRITKALANPIRNARLEALSAIAESASSNEIAALALYFKGRMLQQDKREDDALNSYISIGTLFSSGTVLTTSAAELQTAIILSSRKDRLQETVAILKSAANAAPNTRISQEAHKRLESLEDQPAEKEPQPDAEDSPTPPAEPSSDH